MGRHNAVSEALPAAAMATAATWAGESSWKSLSAGTLRQRREPRFLCCIVGDSPLMGVAARDCLCAEPEPTPIQRPNAPDRHAHPKTQAPAPPRNGSRPYFPRNASRRRRRAAVHGCVPDNVVGHMDLRRLPDHPADAGRLHTAYVQLQLHGQHDQANPTRHAVS